MEKDVLIEENHLKVPAFFITPEKDLFSAVILIHEVWGLNENIREISRRLFKEGYAVLAPDILEDTGITKILDKRVFKAFSDPAERNFAQKKIREALSPMQSLDFSRNMIAKLKACHAYLEKMENVADVAVMGFCFGGTYSFALAVNEHRLKACVVYYGMPPDPIEGVQKIRCPILAFYGEADERLIASFPALKGKMEAYGKDFRYKIYKKSGHAFFNDKNRLMYNKAAADDSWRKVLEFLKETLTP